MSEKSRKKYLIGDISKMTGIPVQTLRYYEDRGILKPHRNETSGYRYYSAWDTNDVFDLMILKDNHFSIDQIESLIHSADTDQIDSILKGNTMDIQKEINQLNHSLKTISLLQQNLEKTKHISEYDREESPSLSFYLYRKENDVENKEGSRNLKQLYEERKGWIDQIGNLTPTFLVDSLSPLSWYWGFSDIHKEILENEIHAEPDYVIDGNTSLHTVFEAHDEGTFEEALKNVLNNVDNMNLSIFSHPYGTLLIKTHDHNTYTRYFEIWIPVTEK